MKDRRVGDFAVVGVHLDSVVLEANEWDFSISGHRVVTLYLHPEHALQLATELSTCAGVLEQPVQP